MTKLSLKPIVNKKTGQLNISLPKKKLKNILQGKIPTRLFIKVEGAEW